MAVAMFGGDDVQALVNHYARAGYARHIQTACAEALKSRRGDPTLAFWRTYGMIAEGSHSEAIAQFESLMRCVDRRADARARRAPPPPLPPARATLRPRRPKPTRVPTSPFPRPR